MEGKRELFIIFGVSIFLLIGSLTFYFIKSSDNVPSYSNLEECNTIHYSGEDAINLVFLSTEQQAEEYSSFLLKTSPFDEKPSAFNVFQINYLPKCEIYKGVAILCNSKDTIKAAASCPNDYIAVIDEQPSNIRSSAYQNIMSINSVHSLNVLIHEFGHVFANLAEEYTPATIPRGSKNCQSTCEGFKSEIDGCFQGCSKTDYHRSIQNGVMKTLSTADYGTFNKNLIRELMDQYLELSPITGQATTTISSCSTEKYVLLEVKNQEGVPTVIDKKLVSGCAPSSKSVSGEISYEVYDIQGNLISKEETNLIIFTDVQGQEEISGETYDGGIDNSFILTTSFTTETSFLSITVGTPS